MYKSIFDKCKNWNVADEERKKGTYPYFRAIEAYDKSHVYIDGKRFLMCGTNNYLGLSLDPRVKEGATKAIVDYGTSCSGSRFLNGTLKLHEVLESKLVDFTGKEAAICYTTGYQSNLGTLATLVDSGEHIISDKFNHASIMDSIFFSMGMKRSIKFHRYKHNDMSDLERKLKSIPKPKPKLVVTDGVFSMEGTIVNLPDLCKICREYNAAIYLDEAHAFGVLGANGKGTEEHYNHVASADIIMGTFSKSFGSIGGFVAGNAKVIDYVKHFSRPLIFSASMPPANLAAAITTLDIITKEPERILRLQQIARQMINGFKKRGFDVGETMTPIVPLITGDFDRTLVFFQKLYERGIYVNPVIPPAVPPNRCLLRTSYMATMEDDDLNYFLEVATEEAGKLGIIS